MAKQDINLDDRSTHIIVSDSTFMLPADDLFPADNIYPGGIEVVSNIVYGTMSLEELIVDDEIQFGNLYSTKFEVQLYDTDADLTGKYIIVYQEIDDVAKYIFTGRIDSCKQNADGLDKTIVAYDEAYELNQKNVAPWWNQFWSNRTTATLKQCRDSLLTYIGIGFENVQLMNDSITVQKNVDMTSMTFANMIKMLCEINCCFPHFNRDGSMEFIVPDTESTATNLEGLYEGVNSSFEEYTTDEVTGVAFYDSSGELKRVVGDQTNVYPVGVNIFLYSMGTEQIDTIGNNMLDYISSLTFTPAEVKMIIGSFDYALGDKMHTSKGDFYIFQNNFSGTQLIEQTMVAKGKKSLGEGSFPQSLESNVLILNEKISRITADVEQYESYYSDALEQTNSRITQTASELTLQVNSKNSSFTGRYTPTTSNAPAAQWTTEELKAAHENDTFYDEESGNTYRWGRSQDGIVVKFSDKCSTEISSSGYMYDYVRLYFPNGSMGGYPFTETLGGGYNGRPNNLAGREIFIPSSMFYLYWFTDGSANDYGFKIDSVDYVTSGELKDFSSNSSLPSNSYEGRTLANLPESDHPYGHDIRKLYQVSTGYSVTGYQWRWIQVDEAQVRETNSRLQILQDSINIEVERAETAEESVRSSISTSINGIRLSTSSGSTSSTIALTYNGTQIDSKSITFTGFATFNGLSGGTTTINGSCLKTGIISDTYGNMSINLSTGKITAKQFSLSSTYLTIDEYGNLYSGTNTNKVFLENGQLGASEGTEGTRGYHTATLDAGKLLFSATYKVRKGESYSSCCSIGIDDPTSSSGSRRMVYEATSHYFNKIGYGGTSGNASVYCGNLNANSGVYTSTLSFNYIDGSRGEEYAYTGWFTDATGSGNGIKHKGGYCDMRWEHGVLVEISPW